MCVFVVMRGLVCVCVCVCVRQGVCECQCDCDLLNRPQPCIVGAAAADAAAADAAAADTTTISSAAVSCVYEREINSREGVWMCVMCVFVVMRG